MQTIRSRDGTPIAFEQGGSGPPLVLVHGTAGDHMRWAPVAPSLQSYFTVYAIDRRGRGASGDAVEYQIEREFDDVAAVLDAIGQPTDLLGHSYGGICALEAALRTGYVRRLILYEPPLATGAANVFPPELVAEMQKQLDAGDRAAAVTLFLRQIVRVPPNELDQMQASPAWAGRVAAAHTVLREMYSANTLYQLQPERFSAWRTPTLLLVGGESPPLFSEAIKLLQQTLPHSQVVTLPRQRHTAMDTAPELFLGEVLKFLQRPA